MRKKRSIAERQEHCDRMCKAAYKIAEYIVPIIVSSIASAVLCIMVMR
ncbi:hypothetical protein [Candidatus Acetatifactor stercoripullorum]|nr:hypothetical protein [Candidatus Acetatifactor stercoripullorum]